MAAIFSLLPAIGKQIDRMVGQPADIQQVENAVKPVTLAIKTSRKPSDLDVFALAMMLSKAVSTTDWAKRNVQSLNTLVGQLINGFGYRDQWIKIEAGTSCLASEPYRTFLVKGYSYYSKFLEITNTTLPVFTSPIQSIQNTQNLSSRATTPATEPVYTQKSTSSGTLDSTLNISTTTTCTSSLDSLFPSTDKKK
jgi:hypothetical protein